MNMNKAIRKLMGIVPALAMALAVTTATATCHFFVYQPDVPDALKKFEE